MARISWCAAHEETDIRVRQYGELSCPSWHPDDECVIVEALVVICPETLTNAEAGLVRARTDGTAQDGQSRGSDEDLGPCGCSDYHMADCPLLVGGGQGG